MIKCIPIIFFFTVLFSCTNDTANRIYRDISLTEKTKFSYPGRVVRVFGDEKDYIYISGDPLVSVLKYNLDGKVVDTIGVKGSGPTEFSSIWWYEKESDTTYYDFDYSKNKIRLQHSDTDSLISWRTFTEKSNVIGIGSNQFMTTKLQNNGDYVFSKFDFDNNEYETIEKVNQFNKDKSKTDLDFVYYGEFSKSETGDTVLYYCLNSPLFFTISLKDQSVNRYTDFRGLEVPTAQRYGKKTVLEPSQLCFLGGGLYKDNIFLLTTQQDVFYVQKSQDFFIDIYSSSTGTYKESIKLPPNDELYAPTDLKIFGTKLIIVYSYQNLVIYDLEEIL